MPAAPSAAIGSLEAPRADWRLLETLPPKYRERLQRALTSQRSRDRAARRKRKEGEARRRLMDSLVDAALRDKIRR